MAQCEISLNGLLLIRIEKSNSIFDISGKREALGMDGPMSRFSTS